MAKVHQLEKSLEVLEIMMNSICWFLKLTMESVTDFGGVLPTLDLIIWVRPTDNKTMYSFYEKPNLVIQKVIAMPENMRMSTLNQEMTRRMMNTSEMVPLAKRLEIVDGYGQKLTDSGYGIDQIRRVIVRGLTGYERILHLSKDVTAGGGLCMRVHASMQQEKEQESMASPAKRQRQDEGGSNVHCVRALRLGVMEMPGKHSDH
jgi:hypothetical protein